MDQLISACRAYASELPPKVMTWDDYAAVFIFMAFAAIGFIWTLNKIFNFVFARGGIFNRYD